jgi:hypothetical protein
MHSACRVSQGSFFLPNPFSTGIPQVWIARTVFVEGHTFERLFCCLCGCVKGLIDLGFDVMDSACG